MRNARAIPIDRRQEIRISIQLKDIPSGQHASKGFAILFFHGERVKDTGR
jgi:hypothetical protein